MRPSPRRHSLSRSKASLVAAFLTVLLVSAAPVTAQGGPAGGPPEIDTGPPEWAFGQQALGRVGSRLPAVARAYGLNPDELRQMFLGDPTLAVDENDELLYVDVAPPTEERVEEAGESTATAPPTSDPVFSLASNPGADHTIYLDFDGHVTNGTSWLSGGEIVSPAYDIDSQPDAWSSTELNRIRATFEAVAEDFAPFDVNVTTIEPTTAQLSRTSSTDTTWGTRVVFTSDTAGLCGCGGIAYIGSFDDQLDEPVFVFNRSLTGIVEAATHEVGHAMLLSHDGHGSSTYYGGHGSGTTSWGPLMGAPYNRNVTQWSAGDYYDATNIGPDANYGRGADDLAILSSLTNGNGFGYRDDDHGDDHASATPAGSGIFSGIISETSDVDAFAVSSGGQLSISVVPHPANPNLDTHVTVYNSAGVFVSQSPDTDALSSSLDLTGLTPGTYIVAIDGIGWGNPLSPTTTGWTGYGSLGQYTLTITADDGPVDNEAPAVPTGLAVTGTTESTVSMSWNANSEPDLASYTVYRSDDQGASFSAAATIPAGQEAFTDSELDADTTYFYAVTANDQNTNVSPRSAAVSAATQPPSVSPDTATGQTQVSGTVTGNFDATWTSDGIAQTITESHSGGKPRDRHDRAEHIWHLTATGGNDRLEIHAEVADGGDADDGFELSWSSSTSGPWTTISTLQPGPTRGSFDLGSPSGPVFVRVVDTDRSARNSGYDSVAVDLLRLTSPQPATEAPAAASGPQPVDGATGVAASPTLSWSPADGAASYDVTVTSGGLEVFAGSTTSTSIVIGSLAGGTTYSWRVDAVNEVGTTTGPAWTFTTATPATTASVSSLVELSVSAGRGTRQALADVVIVDDNGQPVAGAEVTVRFSGDINEDVTGVTDAEGRVVVSSNSAVKKLSFSACVLSLSAPGLIAVPGVYNC